MTLKPLVLAGGVVGLLACGAAQGQTPARAAHPSAAMTAGAALIDAEGVSVGRAHLRQTPHGVLLELDLEHAAAGRHGLHIHDAGRCDRPSFASAGGHFNPSGREHGFLNPAGPHAGDLPNIEIPASKQLSVEYLIADVTLEPGPRSLLDANGSAIVIHADQDDYGSDPAGDAGDRLACGPITRAPAR